MADRQGAEVCGIAGWVNRFVNRLPPGIIGYAGIVDVDGDALETDGAAAAGLTDGDDQVGAMCFDQLLQCCQRGTEFRRQTGGDQLQSVHAFMAYMLHG